MKMQDIKNRIEDISVELDGLKAKADEGTATAEDLASVKALIEERKTLMAQRDAMQELQELEIKPSPFAQDVHVIGPAAEQEPYSLGQYLQDIAKSARQIESGGIALPRVANYQKKVLAAATGNQEGVGSEGGFLVGEEFSDEIVKRAYDNNQVISRCRKRSLTKSNKITLNGVDETSRANGSRHGGIQSYWMAEADALTGSRPKWRKMNFELKKHGILYYATDEVLDDAQMLQAEVEDAVSDELAFKLQDAIINGDGAGKPLGILQSPALVSQAKESGQVAATIVYENILKMLTRKWGPLSNYVWLINQDIYPQLGLMNVAIGTGGAPVFLPSGGAADAPFQRLSNIPMVEIEQAQALGTAGDIILADLSQYMVIDKGSVQSAMSIHVQFTTDETVFRWIYRIDGMPLWDSALTPFKGSATRSPFVALATRS